MKTFTVETSDVNVEVLDADLRNSLPSTSGVRWDGRELTVYLADDASPAQITQARRIVEQHDPRRLSVRQQEAAKQQERLEALRNQNAVLLNETDYVEAPDNIRALARRVAWLEQEVIRMVGSEGGRI